jgi:hypothetical protein
LDGSLGGVGVFVEGEVGAEEGWRFSRGDALRSNEPPRALPPVFPVFEDFEGLLLLEEDLEELDEDLEELDEDRLEERPPQLLASALDPFNHSAMSRVVGSIVT